MFAHVSLFKTMRVALKIKKDAHFLDTLKFFMGLPGNKFEQAFALHEKSASQFNQDLFVLSTLGFMRSGYFVEFDATDGLGFSNSILLEQEFGWSGILAEPARVWHERLSANRAGCAIDFDCVWKETGQQIMFQESDSPLLSSISDLETTDFHQEKRAIGHSYPVRTVSLVDLLRRHGAPRDIDYLSIDTEGIEYEILSAFDFEMFRIKIITCEHNWTPDRGRIFNLLTSKGYKRVMVQTSGCDDWYVLHDN